MAAPIARGGLAVVTAAAGAVLAIGPVPAGAAARPAAAFSFQVNSTADSHDAHPGDGTCADSRGRCTLRAAIEEASAAPAGSTISVSVPAGTYKLTLGTLREWANTVTVTGAGGSSTVIQGNGSFGVLQISPAVTASLTGLTITGGNAGRGYGGGVLSYGHTTISNSAVTGNTAIAGGGITNSGGTLTVRASTVSGNTAAVYGGGGIQNGGLRNLPGSVTVVSTTIKGNTAGGDGGGILNGQNGHPALAGRAAVPRRRPSAPQARPAAYPLGFTVTNSTISDNTSSNAGGGIANDGGTLTVTGSTLDHNTCPGAIGGGIENFGNLSVAESTLRRNSSSGGIGGGIEAYFGNVPGTVTIIRSTLAGNSAAVGGGLDDSTAISVTASTLDGNTAGAGGGIFVEGSSSVTVLNSTLTANTATQPGNGGALQTYACGTATISYTTISGNSTGLDLSCSDVQLTGTIVASSTSGANCTGAVPAESYGYNLDSGTSCGFAKPTDLTSTSPALGPLANHGGPTQTELPRPGSPAINHGGLVSNSCPSTDQRGYHRPFGPACDIGSAEVQH